MRRAALELERIATVPRAVTAPGARREISVDGRCAANASVTTTVVA
jgi:hypothetical protein